VGRWRFFFSCGVYLHSACVHTTLSVSLYSTVPVSPLCGQHCCGFAAQDRLNLCVLYDIQTPSRQLALLALCVLCLCVVPSAPSRSGCALVDSSLGVPLWCLLFPVAWLWDWGGWVETSGLPLLFKPALILGLLGGIHSPMLLSSHQLDRLWGVGGATGCWRRT
jgi:hypothetical protein